MRRYITILRFACRLSQIDFQREGKSQHSFCSRYLQIPKIQNHTKPCLLWELKWRLTHSNTVVKLAAKPLSALSHSHDLTVGVPQPRGSVDSNSAYVIRIKFYQKREGW